MESRFRKFGRFGGLEKSVTAGLIGNIGGGDKSPRRFVKAMLLIVRQIVTLCKTKSLKRLIKKRVGKIRGKRGEAGGTVHGKKV